MERIKYLRQAIGLSGLGLPLFDLYTESLAQLYALLARQIPHTGLASNTLVDVFDRAPSINLSNRYFTPKREAALSDYVPFSHEVDPKGVLAALAGNKFVHTKENEVQYFVRVLDEDGGFRYVNAHHGKDEGAE
jgi:hypothetical protein